MSSHGNSPAEHPKDATNNPGATSLNFVEQIIEEHNRDGRFEGRVHFRFPPEPNGYLHIGHAKAICVNFSLADKYGGKCNLRFDDTNPTKEETEFVDAIKDDITWLGFKWEEPVHYASDYFGELYKWAVRLIKAGKAYVDDSNPEEMRVMRGTPTEPGTASKYRERSPEENLDLFERMKAGEFDEGSRILRAKIDLSSPNMHMRDPALYRILKSPHHRTGTDWCIYPMYDWAHGQSDSIEGITHSLCTLEFEVHRELYDWFVNELEIYAPQQIEFARLNLDYTIMSKRKLRLLVEEKHVSGWDDPRMPTIRGMRRRGYPAESIRRFCDAIGVAKRNNIIELALLEYWVKEVLNRTAPRVMAVLDPVTLIIENMAEGEVDLRSIENNPEDPEGGGRQVALTRECWIERDDFMEEPPRKFFRLGPGRAVRLKGGIVVLCTGFNKDETGNVTAVRVKRMNPDDPAEMEGIKVKGTIHWVSKTHAQKAEVRLYDRLFADPAPDGHKDKDFLNFINPDSLNVLTEVYVEEALKGVTVGHGLQFLRKGYFCLDPDSTEDKMIFNRTVTLRDNWAKKKS